MPDEISKDDLEEIEPIEVESFEDIRSEQDAVKKIKIQLEKEKEKAASYEKQIQYLLADFENLKKRSEVDIQNRVNSVTDGIIIKFLTFYDDFMRARDALMNQNIDTKGLDAILKNMDSFLSELGVAPIDALGEIFNPKLHEAISIKQDSSLDENTITTELRKGYILKNRVIRPSLVEISKQNIKETNVND